jgi:hypothetical protein
MSDTGEANRARERGNGGRTRGMTDQDRSGAASVSRRWWEEVPQAESVPLFNPARSESANRPAGVAPPPPPPPPPPSLRWNSAPSSAQQPSETDANAARIQRLEQELAAARDEAMALHEMLEDLPEIFERKFRQRLHGILEQQQLLLADNRMLREQLFALQPAPEAPAPRLLPPAPAPVDEQSPNAGVEPLRRVLHGMRRLGMRLRSTRLSGRSDVDDFSDRDDGPPRGV